MEHGWECSTWRRVSSEVQCSAFRRYFGGPSVISGWLKYDLNEQIVSGKGRLQVPVYGVWSMLLTETITSPFCAMPSTCRGDARGPGPQRKVTASGSRAASLHNFGLHGAQSRASDELVDDGIHDLGIVKASHGLAPTTLWQCHESDSRRQFQERYEQSARRFLQHEVKAAAYFAFPNLLLIAVETDDGTLTRCPKGSEAPTVCLCGWLTAARGVR